MSVVTIFRSRLRADAENDYAPLSDHMMSRAQQMPGFVDAKTFQAPDGERVTIVTFEDQDAHNQWREDLEHRAAMRRGIGEFYNAYSIQVATVSHETNFVRPDSTEGPPIS